MKKYFQLEELGTNYRTEFMAGLTTFLAMAYILFVNPDMLSLAGVEGVPDGMGMDPGAVFTATAIAAAVGTLMMGIVARYPIVLAPGMGLNAFFAYTVILTYEIPWETALSGVLASGIIFLFITVIGLREKIINTIPENLKLAVGAGIGFFIAFVGFKNAGIIVADDSTLVTLGSLSDPLVLLALFGLAVSVVLLSKGIKGGIFYSMILTSIVGMIFGLVPKITGIGDVVGAVPSIAPTFGQAFINFGDIFTIEMLIVILTFLFVDFFDTAGTLVAVANQAGLMKNGKLPRAGRALFADSTATVVGSVVGTSTTTAYVESTTGVGVGGRTGLTAVFAALFFILALFFSPLLNVVTPQVTASALIIVGVLMSTALKQIEWDKFEIAVPAFFVIIAMPLTSSIATGIALGFIFYPVTMLMAGRIKEVHPATYGMFVIFILYFAFLT